jgi:uncharacterized membrane protein
MSALRIAHAIGRFAYRAAGSVFGVLIFIPGMILAMVATHFVIGALEHLVGWTARVADGDEIASSLLICTLLLVVSLALMTKAICEAIRSLRTLNVAGDVNATVRHIDGGTA